MRRLSQLTLLAAATVTLHGNGFTDIHPAGYDTNSTFAYGVSADGLVAVGYSTITAGIAGSACSSDGLGFHDLGLGAGSYATGIAANGTIVGTKPVSGLDQAFRLSGGVTTLLGDLMGGGSSANALAISRDGSTIVGHSFDGMAETAFKWTSGGGMVALTPLNTGFGSRATGVSDNGGVIVGWMSNHFGQVRAFSYVSSALEELPGQSGQGTYALAVSGNGQVIVGGAFDDIGYYHAFRYTAAEGFVSLGSLGGSADAEAHAVNADGSVIVGWSLAGPFSSQHHAFKYQSGVMTDLGTLSGGTTSDATGVSADGSVIVGYGTVAGGYTHAFVYANQTMLDADEWLRSLNGPGSVLAMTCSLSAQPLEGAHHRPLMSYDGMGKQDQAWATGDFGTSSRQAESHLTSGEIGVSHAVGDFVFGLAVGHASLNQDLLFGGSAGISGNTLLAEGDYRLPDKESIVSLVVMRGDYSAETSRGYDTGSGIDYSSGRTNVRTSAARLRFDGPAQKFTAPVVVSPFASFTLTRTTADAYAESGGSFPASFADQAHTAQEGRLGLTAKHVASPSTTLLFSAEWIHRFDGAGAGLAATSSTMGTLTAAGIAPTANQARFGFDVDHKLSADTLLNLSLHAAGVGPSSDFSAALSLRRAF
jgi:probable HAF family extracellular repeat protein